jgi:DNA replication protein DnaC
MAEARKLQTATREELMAEYGAEVQRRRAELEGAPTRGDMARRLQAAGTPVNAIVAVQGCQDTRAVLAARKWARKAASISPGLLLSGKTGVGKSVGAAAACWAWAENFDWQTQPTGAATPMVWVFGSKLSEGNAYSNDERQWFESLLACKLLVVDDLGREAGMVGAQRVAGLLMQRLDAGKRTVITTNAAVDQLATAYGTALVDRLRSRAVSPALETVSLRAAKPVLQAIGARP